MFYSIINLRTRRAQGPQALLRIDAANGAVEIGNILSGPEIARSRMSPEAFHLAAQYIFDDLGYRVSSGSTTI